jgi:putative ABC transport system permease protein
VLLSLLSGVVGIVLGIALTKAISLVPVASYLSAEYGLAIFAQTLAVTLVLGVLGGIYPAWRASRLSPVEALRYE